MRRTFVLALALAVVPAAVAVAGSGLKVTGGGQVVAGGESGPGDTIAFNAQQTRAPNEEGVSAAKGQLQVIDRLNQTRFHGEVTCIRTFTNPDSDEEFVRFGGVEKVRGKATAVEFTVDTQDNGEPNQGNDMILFRKLANDEDPCDTTEERTELRSTSLARGNVQAH